MIPLIRLAVAGFVVLTLVYWLVQVYSRSVRREKLEKKWDAGGEFGTREDYVAQGMKDYDKGLRRKLILLVYVIPTLVVVATVYLVNWE